MSHKPNPDVLIRVNAATSISAYIAGGIFVQAAEAFKSIFYGQNTKECKYIKNKVDDAIKAAEKLSLPISKTLSKDGIEIASVEIDRLIELISDISDMEPKDRKRIQNLINKIQEEKRKKLFGNTKMEAA